MNPLQGHTSDADEPVAAIVPEPDELVRAAILRALAASCPPQALSGWAAAVLHEGVGPEEDDHAVSPRRAGPLQQHDVCSLW